MKPIINSTMTGGASGGPWLDDYDYADSIGYVIGLTSRAATDQGTSVRLTASIVPEHGWIRLRSTVVGAQPGREYRIVVLDGVTLDGTVAVPSSEVTSVAVVDADDRRYESVSFA